MKNPLVVCLCQRRMCFLISVSILVVLYFLIMDSFINNSRVTEHQKCKTLQNFVTNEDIGLYSRSQEPAGVWTFSNSSPRTVNKETNKTKLILLWSPLFSGWNFLKPGMNSFKDSGCSEIRCEISSDRNRFLESDAILFHVRTMSLLDIPRNRTANQKWIFFSLEAPAYSRFHGFAFMSGMYNWTMTYRSDSDVVIRYGRVARVSRNYRTTQGESFLYSQWKNKSNMAVWMVSHCLTAGNREGFVREMQKYLDVTTFGECGLAVCTFNKTNECLENFSKKYFFYLSFENAICEDYVTEKFYRILNYNMIPVVFGGNKYSSTAPPDSYINALDFENAEALSIHMYHVASNFSLFASYFKWRLDGYDIEDSPNHCDLCEKLHSKSFQDRTSYNDIDEWWVKKSHCRRWDDV